jgi:hypothetical protein
VAIVHTCLEIENLLDEELSHLYELKQKPSDYYYKLDEKFNSFYLQFPIAKRSFFQKRLQELSLTVFESGISQAWNKGKLFAYAAALKERQFYENEDYFMKLFDIAPAFYVLGLGMGLSFMVLLMEIFCHDFLRLLSWRVFKQRFGRIFNIRRRLNIRFIQVQPRIEVV